MSGSSQGVVDASQSIEFPSAQNSTNGHHNSKKSNIAIAFPTTTSSKTTSSDIISSSAETSFSLGGGGDDATIISTNQSGSKTSSRSTSIKSADVNKTTTANPTNIAIDLIFNHSISPNSIASKQKTVIFVAGGWPRSPLEIEEETGLVTDRIFWRSLQQHLEKAGCRVLVDNSCRHDIVGANNSTNSTLSIVGEQTTFVETRQEKNDENINNSNNSSSSIGVSGAIKRKLFGKNTSTNTIIESIATIENNYFTPLLDEHIDRFAKSLNLDSMKDLENTFFIAHSFGANVVLRYIQSLFEEQHDIIDNHYQTNDSNKQAKKRQQRSTKNSSVRRVGGCIFLSGWLKTDYLQNFKADKLAQKFDPELQHFLLEWLDLSTFDRDKVAYICPIIKNLVFQKDDNRTGMKNKRDFFEIFGDAVDVQIFDDGNFGKSKEKNHLVVRHLPEYVLKVIDDVVINNIEGLPPPEDHCLHLLGSETSSSGNHGSGCCWR